MKIIVMAGGTGSRLWPVSRSLQPKQFLSLVDERTMLQSTLCRAVPLTDELPLIICNEEHRFIAAEQVREIGMEAEILLEPVGRNTAPAIALSALQSIKGGQDPLLLVLAADHLIEDIKGLWEQVGKAKHIAEAGSLVTFGIVPSKPETGYGYIRCGDQIQEGYAVSEFIEKPDLDVAQEYLSKGGYLWNSGMFLFKASRYLEELGKFRPDILDICEASLKQTTTDLDFIRIDEDVFKGCPDQSIDYAIMEKTSAAVVMPLDAEWSDVGSWSSLWDVLPKDVQGNVLRGDVIAHKTENSLIDASSRLVATVGVKDAVIIETPDVVLVADRYQVQDVKRIVEKLKLLERSEVELHRKVYRPWGRYDSIDSGDRYQVKHLTVNPGGKLSLQMHHHRAEHWIVVSGTAKVYRDDKILLLTENESIYIPAGSIHSLENPGKIPLELIEVQSGSYLGEDDIVRIQDDYGRVVV
ncbi:mannose-1-phosphate guanylyltransferase/mannose-6-phosphate isomerase [Neptuniibacter sp. QD48_55]|uniref:mannose-1-phosphate guanylyltransferase/mannose-6-phosphate isomerase n=1 Tax=Neptuniibacter sp. QD48_55 TaxID=3398212 RepID=UPI0039F4D5DE